MTNLVGILNIDTESSEFDKEFAKLLQMCLHVLVLIVIRVVELGLYVVASVDRLQHVPYVFGGSITSENRGEIGYCLSIKVQYDVISRVVVALGVAGTSGGSGTSGADPPQEAREGLRDEKIVA